MPPIPPNYLIGKGERLTEEIKPLGGGGPKKHPYTFSEAQHRLMPEANRVTHDLDLLPRGACPADEAVALFTLHPAYMAKSYYPQQLLDRTGLRGVGSRETQITPEKWTRRGEPEASQTTQLFVAGARDSFRQFAGSLGAWTESTPGARDLIKVETMAVPSAIDRLRNIAEGTGPVLLEVALHADGLPDSHYILDGFRAYLRSLGIRVDLDKRMHAGGLCFLPLRVPREELTAVASFSFLRVARGMPKLRPLRPAERSSPALQEPFACTLPTGPALDQSIRVAVFDGGIPALPQLAPWVQAHDGKGVGRADPDDLQHGVAVTSALLFGPLVEGQTPPMPYARVDHWRVIDEDTIDDDELFDVLERIVNVLRTHQYDFVNISLGPDLPIEDDEVHPWSAMIDSCLTSGQTLATVAVGNTGENDRASGNARVQPPTDCVNALSVGAADRPAEGWARATYSSLGPGRRPGFVKPDGVAFGGSDSVPYWALDCNSPDETVAVQGTSFAAPTALRAGIGVRALLGSQLSLLAIKALLIHRAEEHDSGDRCEFGWGRIPCDPEQLIVCENGTAHVIYQGELEPGKYLRAHIPMPQGPLKGMFTISATICFATVTDPQDPVNYTRSGVEVRFRPHRSRTSGGKGGTAKTRPFFQVADYATEDELRTDGLKWETVLRGSVDMRASSLDDPVFDLHYTAREGGKAATNPPKIPYAMIVTVKSKTMANLYNAVLTRYPTLLEPLRPSLRVPVRTRAES